MRILYTGHGSAKWVYTPKGFPNQVIHWIIERIKDSLKHGETVRIPWLRQELEDEFGIKANRALLSRVLKKCAGAQWGRTIIHKSDLDTPQQQLLRRNFCIKYAMARRLQEDGKAIICFFDETYIHTGHHAKDTWFIPGVGLTAPSTGKRLICLHAMTKGGPVVSRDQHGNPLELTDIQNADLKTVQLTAEMIYQAGKAEGDYHDNMDSATFLAWLEYRLFPTLRHLYPGTRYILVLDNASYHKEKVGLAGKKWKSFGSMNKAELAELAIAWDMKNMEVTRTGRRTHLLLPAPEQTKVFTQSQYALRHPKGPSTKEMISALNSKKNLHPDYFLTVAERWLRRQSEVDCPGNASFHQFLFTPPNEGFEAQITENWWGDAKGYVANAREPKGFVKQHNIDTYIIIHSGSMSQLKKLLREGLYGVQKTIVLRNGRSFRVAHQGAVGSKLVSHSEQNINRWISADPLLEGSVSDLTVTGVGNFSQPSGSFVISFESSDSDMESDAEEAQGEIDQILLDQDGYSAESGDQNDTVEHTEPNDPEEEKDTKREGDDDCVYWVQCGLKRCGKWRLFDTPWTRKHFRCSESPGSQCAEECDGCNQIVCTCPQSI